MKHILTFRLILASLLADYDFLGITGDQYLKVIIQTDKEKYVPGESRVVTFTNKSDQPMTIKQCSWILEKKENSKWEMTNGAVCEAVAWNRDIIL